MVIAGFQPLSLLDYPETPCSIIFTQGCLFRCSYCHNPELISFERSGKKSFDEILLLVEKRKHIVGAVCITGGEPTLQPDLIDCLHTLKRCGISVKLDTNGVRPLVVAQVINEGLVDYIAMDIKQIWENYADVTRVAHRSYEQACQETMKTIQNSRVSHEFRTTILPGVHTQEDFFRIASLLREGETYSIQKTRFEKTLEPVLQQNIGFDVSRLVASLQENYPLLFIYER
jgi:pyruvate formate lyase activating enzyme